METSEKNSKEGASPGSTRDHNHEIGDEQVTSTSSLEFHSESTNMAPPKGMRNRYESLKKLYSQLNRKNVKEFFAKGKLFLSTPNKLIQREQKKVCRKLYGGMFQKIAVFVSKAERKFLKKTR